MKNINNKNIIKYTLESYIGKPISEIETTERQKEAIDRLFNLREDKFDEICYDVCNEIHRRNGMKYDVKNKMCEKFSMLTEMHFKNLVVDLLVVYYLKNPDKKPESMPAFLNSLETLIDSLKSEAENQNFLYKIKNLNFYHKIQEFITYLKSNKIDTNNDIDNLFDYMILELKYEIENESIKFFEALSYPEILIEQFEKTKYFLKLKPEVQNEIKNLKQKIQINLKVTNKDEIIKISLLQILEIIVNNSQIPARNIECYENEIKILIESLESIKNELKNQIPINFKILISRLNNVIEKISENNMKKPFIHYKPAFDEILNNLKEDKNNNKINAYKTILAFAKDFSIIIKK